MARVLLLTTHLNMGGIATYTVELARALHRRGHPVLIGSSGGDWVPEVERMGIRHVRLPLDAKSELHPKVMASAMSLARLVRAHRIELVHAQTRVAQVAAFSASRVQRVPLVSTCHGFFRPSPGRRLFPCWGERVIAISDAVREHLIRSFGMSGEVVRLIYNGIDVARFPSPDGDRRRREARQAIGITGGPVIGAVARLVPSKGHRYLILALEAIKAKFPDVKLVIVGEGPMRGQLRQLVRDLALDDVVVFLEPRMHTHPVLAAMDLFVLPSLQEGLGIAILEAMACGLPVIAFDVGGVSSVVRPGTNGLLVPAMDVKKLTQAILEVLGDPARAVAMGREGRELVESQFSAARMAEQVEALYEELLTG